MHRVRHTGVIALAAVGLAAVIWARASAQGGSRDVSIEGNEFAFAPARIEVQRDDLVKVTFTARDMAHSFAIDSYRIVKRAGAGQTVVFEFRADRPGTYPFYCNLSLDERCRNMRGELIVR
ncbi:MAG TPA: cupredoxin domain-containing protein [Vicinamibacterales bacterium]|nr:cupredoxin domain-containing protein [Vicinamibacterales bacterium]